MCSSDLKTIAELRFLQRYNVVVVLLEHDGEQFAPSPSRPFDIEDKLWVLGHKTNMDKIIDKESEE